MKMRRRVPSIVVALMTSLLTSTAVTALRSVDHISSPQPLNLSYWPTSSFSTTDVEPLTVVSGPAVGRTRYTVAARTTSSPVAVSRRPLNVDEPRNSNASKDFAAFTKSLCRFGSVDDDDGRLLARRLDKNCRTSSKRDADVPSHAGNPLNVILKSFFDDSPTLPTTNQSKHRQLAPHNKQRNSNRLQSTSPATVELLVKDGHEFLWSVDTSDDYDDVPESDNRRSAEEEVADKFPTNGCALNRLSDEISPYDCTMDLTGTGNNLTLNASRADGDFRSFTAGEMVSIVVVGIILSGICLATVVGNVLVLVAIISNGHLRGTTHYFIANLAVADLLLGVAVLPFSTTLETIDRWVFGETFCDVWAALDVLCCTASILSLCVISVDRYVGVTRPLQHSVIMSERRAGWVIVGVWLLSLAISVAPLFGWKEPRDPDSHPGICDVTKQTGYVLFSVAGSFYIPLSVILVVYYRVYREAVRQSRFLITGIKTTDSDYSGSSTEVTLRVHTGRLAAGGGGSVNNSRKGSAAAPDVGHHRPTHLRITVAGKVAKFKREKKAAKTLGIVVGVFVLCWFPFFFVLPLGK